MRNQRLYPKPVIFILSFAFLIFTYLYSQKGISQTVGPVDCSIVPTELFSFEENALKLDFSNAGQRTAVLSDISITWPEEYGNLNGLVMQGRLWKGSQSPPTAIFRSTDIGNEKRREIRKGKKRTLKFLFANDLTQASTEEFDLEVVFDDGCTVSFISDGLPPDPGEAGLATLEGMDVDSDGVRDDIQRWIALTYPNQEAVQAALTSAAILYQKVLIDANDPDAVLQNTTDLQRVRECLSFIESDTNSASRILSMLKSEYLNTRDRSFAFITHNDNLSGEITLLRPMSAWENSCSFDLNGNGEVQ